MRGIAARLGQSAWDDVRASWDSYHSCARWHVLRHNGASANGRTRSNFSILQDDGARPDQHSIPKLHPTGNVRTWIDDATAAHDGFVAEGGAKIHHGERFE